MHVLYSAFNVGLAAFDLLNLRLDYDKLRMKMQHVSKAIYDSFLKQTAYLVGTCRGLVIEIKIRCNTNLLWQVNYSLDTPISVNTHENASQLLTIRPSASSNKIANNPP